MRFLMLVALLACTAVAQNPPPSNVKEDTWKEFTSQEGRFTVSFPGSPKVQDGKASSPVFTIQTKMFFVQTETATYAVAYGDFPIFPENREETEESLYLVRGQIITGGAKLISEKDIKFGRILGKEMLVEKDSLILRSRFFYVKERLYHLVITVDPQVAFRTGKPSPNAADRTEFYEKISTKFFNSFKLTK